MHLRYVWSVFSVALLAPFLAAADERLVSRGDTIRGHIADITADGLTFEPAYGKGELEVEWKEIENLESDDTFTILHGDDGESQGRILGLVEGKWLVVGDTRETAERIDIGTVVMAFDDSDRTGSFPERIRSRFRFWRASFDAGAAFTDSTTDKLVGTAGLFVERKKGPTRFLVEGGARYAAEDAQHEERDITENTIFGIVRGDYDLTDRIYTYASTRATHDNEQHLSLRLEPRGGFGYHFIKSKTRNWSADIGAAWIYEDYFGDEFVAPPSPLERSRGNDNYWAVAFGTQADAELPYGALWRARAEYLPAVDNWTRDYIARAETTLELPLLEWVSFRIGIADEYDNTPAPGAQRNKFVTTGALAFHLL